LGGTPGARLEELSMSLGGAVERQGRTALVVIGRNEGERLRGCLRSLDGSVAALAYVDSGSTDGSVELARSIGAEVVELDTSRPFTAARARNAGFERVVTLLPNVELVQFVDGDCAMAPGWIEKAQRAFAAEPRLAAVCGHLRERSPEASIYNRMGDLEWRRPVGEIAYCGGIFMVRAAAFREVGGFDPGIAAGEEPELCCRLRSAGYRIRRIDQQMATHDLAMTRFGQWWRRSQRGGYGALRMTLFGPPISRAVFRRQVWSAAMWGVALPLASVAGALAGAAVGAWLTAMVFALLWPVVLVLQGGRLMLRGRKLGLGWKHRAAYAGFTLLWKYAAAVGFARCLTDRFREGSGASASTRESHKAAA
jgi:cellulose synthase/poly-beta-1,6-N-acetylglucosamine synthase-like glycosyltransferase